MEMKLLRRVGAPVAAFVTLLLAMSSANAVIDVTAITGGTTELGVALAAVIAALLAVSVIVFGIGRVYRFFSKKAGG